MISTHWVYLHFKRRRVLLHQQQLVLLPATHVLLLIFGHISSGLGSLCSTFRAHKPPTQSIAIGTQLRKLYRKYLQHFHLLFISTNFMANKANIRVYIHVHRSERTVASLTFGWPCIRGDPSKTEFIQQFAVVSDAPFTELYSFRIVFQYILRSPKQEK